MIALCDHLATTYREALLKNAAQLEGPERIDMFLDFYFGMIEGDQNPKDDAVYDAMMSIAAGSEPIKANPRGQYTLLGHVLSHEFRLAYPSLGKAPSEELPYLFVALMHGHWKMVASLGLSMAHNELTRNAMDRLIRSYIELGTLVCTTECIWAVEG